MTRAYERLTRQLVAAFTARVKHKGKPRVPEAGRLLWNAFHEMSRARTWHQVGPNPIALSEIEAWSRLANIPLARRHVAVILALDEAFLDHAHSAKLPDGATASRQVSTQGLTARLFDLKVG